MNQTTETRSVGRVFIGAVRERAVVLLGLTIFSAALAYGVVARLPERHEVYFSYVVSLTEREVGEEYQFDGYYALQATDLFATTLARWVAAPEVVAAAYERAGLPLTRQSGSSLTRAVKAEKTAPQLVQVTVRADDGAVAEKLAQALREVVAERVAAYHAEGIPELVFRAVPGEEWRGVITPQALLMALAVGGLVLLIGINVVALQIALRTNSQNS